MIITTIVNAPPIGVIIATIVLMIFMIIIAIKYRGTLPKEHAKYMMKVKEEMEKLKKEKAGK